MRKGYIFIILSTILVFIAAKKGDEFSYKTHGNVANYFESEQDFRSFFDFHAGDVIAEIGAGNGNNTRGFNSISENVTIYLQDIDEKTLSERTFAKAIKLGTNASKNKFQRAIGTVSQSNLPDNTFDRIILVSTFHEFSNMDEMMSDIYKKLKTNGRFYILESHCVKASHKNITADETIQILKKHNFKLAKSDGRDINNARGVYRMIFTK